MSNPLTDRRAWRQRAIELLEEGQTANLGRIPSDPNSLPPLVLTAEQTACTACGIPVAWTEQTYSRAERFDVQPTTSNPAGWRYFARCDECQARAELAHHLAPLVDHDAVNGRPVKADAITAALDGMAVAGIQASNLTTREEVLAAVRQFLSVGAAVRWAGHVDADSEGRANETPWSHVPTELRRQAEMARVHLKAEQLAATNPPREIPAAAVLLPEVSAGTVNMPGACLVCGIGVVTMPAVRVLRLERMAPGESVRHCWTVRTTSPASLGIRGAGPTMTRVCGVTCPACSRAIEAEGGALGWSAVTRALLVHLDLWRRAANLVERDLDVPTWASTGSSVPNATPWVHLDPSAIRDTLGPLVPGPLGDLERALASTSTASTTPVPTSTTTEA